MRNGRAPPRWRVARARALGVAMAAWFTPSVAVADEARLIAYGRHLAAECTACHRIDGTDHAIPSITGWPVAEFVATIGFYRDEARPNPVMISVAKSLDDAQTKALALYYGSLPKPAKPSQR